jgi:hypothetical protein
MGLTDEAVVVVCYAPTGREFLERYSIVPVIILANSHPVIGHCDRSYNTHLRAPCCSIRGCLNSSLSHEREVVPINNHLPI